MMKYPGLPLNYRIHDDQTGTGLPGEIIEMNVNVSINSAPINGLISS